MCRRLPEDIQEALRKVAIAQLDLEKAYDKHHKTEMKSLDIVVDQVGEAHACGTKGISTGPFLPATRIETQALIRMLICLCRMRLPTKC